MDRALDGGPDASTGKGHFTRDIYPTLVGQWTPDVNNSTRQGRYTTAMRAIATNSVATCYALAVVGHYAMARSVRLSVRLRA